jgi:hypothetical protein
MLEHFRLATDTPHCNTADSPQCNSAVSRSINPEFSINNVQHRPNVWSSRAHQSDHANVGNASIYSAFTLAIPECNNTDSSPCITPSSQPIEAALCTVAPEHCPCPSNACARELDHAENVDKSISSTFSTAAPHRLPVDYSLHISPASLPIDPALYRVAPEHRRYPSNSSARKSDHAEIIDKSDSPVFTASSLHCPPIASSPCIVPSMPPINVEISATIPEHRGNRSSLPALITDHAPFVDKSDSPAPTASVPRCHHVNSSPHIMSVSSPVDTAFYTDVQQYHISPPNPRARNSAHADFVNKSFCPALTALSLCPWHLCMPLSRRHPHRHPHRFISLSLCHHSYYVPPRLTLAGD